MPWIKVEDKLPETKQPVLVRLNTGCFAIAHLWDDGYFFPTFDGYTVNAFEEGCGAYVSLAGTVEYWMPLSIS